MKVNDIVMYTGYGDYVQHKERVRVLSIGSRVADTYPLKWFFEGVPEVFQHRIHGVRKVPFIRLRNRNLVPIAPRCMFEEVMNSDI